MNVAIWASGLSAGTVQLLHRDQKRKLSTLYFKIDNYVYEAIRTRDIGEHYRSLPPIHRDDVKQQWIDSSKYLNEIETNIKKEIEETLSDKSVWE